VGAPLCEIGSEAVAADVFHFVFVGEGRDGALGEFFGELFPEEDEVCEAAADGEFGALEGLEVGLAGLLGWEVGGWDVDVCGDGAGG
jgi:hypothetical protein